jgi:hypothetical protein
MKLYQRQALVFVRKTSIESKQTVARPESAICDFDVQPSQQLWQLEAQNRLCLTDRPAVPTETIDIMIKVEGLSKYLFWRYRL